MLYRNTCRVRMGLMSAFCALLATIEGVPALPIVEPEAPEEQATDGNDAADQPPAEAADGNGEHLRGLTVVTDVISEPAPLVANWDVVPFQRVTGDFAVGIVAFHRNGVGVTVRHSGAVVGSASVPSYNPRTDVWEYTVVIDFTALPDGWIDLTATVEADGNSNDFRSLESLRLYNDRTGAFSPAVVYVNVSTGNDVNAGTAASPVQTLDQAYSMVGSGGRIYLQAGIYDLSAVSHETVNDSTHWTEITPAPGVLRSDVVVKGGAFNKDRILWHSVTIEKTGTGPGLVISGTHDVWVRDCVLRQEGEPAPEDIVGDLFNIGHDADLYVVDSAINNVNVVFSKTQFARNVKLRNVSGDIIRAATDQVFINVSVDGVYPSPTSHTDIIQIYSPGQIVDNIILYNFKVTEMNSQGIFGGGDSGTGNNMAFVNFIMSSPPTNDRLSQLSSMHGVIMWHCTAVQAEIYLRTPATLSDFDVRNNVFHKFHVNDGEDVIGNTIITHNLTEVLNWNQTAPLGEYGITGDPFVDPMTFRLGVGSPARTPGIELECVPADYNGTPWGSSRYLGAMAD